MRFYIVDVFAEQKYQGNQLAVFIPDEPVSPDEMQQIAKEINFSETTFILSGKQADGGYAVRIFTPDVEIPFAGHPTLGTAFVIQERNEERSSQINLNLGVGQIPVTFAGENGSELWMKQKEPSFGNIIDPNKMAKILQIPPEDMDERFPIQVASTGLPSVIVPLKTLEAVQRCAIHHHHYRKFLQEEINANILIFTSETLNPTNDLHVRVFVNDIGYYEDPATGSANGNLAGYLLEHQFFKEQPLRLRVEQGYSIRRPSLIEIYAEKKEGTFHIHVGGRVFLVAKGDWLRG